MIIERNNLCLLADELINEIRNRKDPFETYSIIVPNLLLEQWFKAYWIQKTNAVLLNVQFKRIRPFINEIFNKDYSNILSSHGAKPIILARRLFDEHLDPELTTLIEDCLRNQYGDGVLFAYRNISDTNYEQNMKKNFICKTL